MTAIAQCEPTVSPVLKPLTHDADALLQRLEAMDDEALDRLPFGVIGFDDQDTITRYNRFEAESTGLNQARTVGAPMFSKIAQCMNNFMVAQVFADARAQRMSVDCTIDYVLTWRMKPTRVKLRLLYAPSALHAYVVLTPRTPIVSPNESNRG